ncbi:hypothetical protein EDD18DRAFT_1109596 [Armillaria luteobubalina]|uniref:Uncharacterized protein n=1 Tax=Armillaria luteobubalina TaxID=153913 RepID=A0AA39PZ99_9AGAR|nr:hypothetical protein EDD18DRAFT_1109596 [Armillaria luteobubalina]
MTYFARHGSRYIKPSRATAMGPSPGCKTGKLDLLATSADTAQVTERKMCAMRALNNRFAFTSGKPVWLGNVGVKPRKATVPLLSPGYGMFLLSGFLWPVGGRSDTQGTTRRRDVGFQGITAADAQGVIHSQNVGIVCTPYRAGLISHRAVPRRSKGAGGGRTCTVLCELFGAPPCDLITSSRREFILRLFSQASSTQAIEY